MRMRAMLKSLALVQMMKMKRRNFRMMRLYLTTRMTVKKKKVNTSSIGETWSLTWHTCIRSNLGQIQASLLWRWWRRWLGWDARRGNRSLEDPKGTTGSYGWSWFHGWMGYWPWRSKWKERTEWLYRAMAHTWHRMKKLISNLWRMLPRIWMISHLSKLG